MTKPELKIDWASYDAAKYACENYHYSGTIPRAGLVKIGVWEGGEFKGVIIYSRRASPNLMDPYGIESTEGCELTRVALRDHEHEVTKMLSKSRKLLQEENPNLRLVVSFADPKEGHLGGIYQADNWFYLGKTNPSRRYKAPDGKLYHPRNISKDGIVKYGDEYRKSWRTDQCESIKLPGKFRYAYPLDKPMRYELEDMGSRGNYPGEEDLPDNWREIKERMSNMSDDQTG